MRELGAHEYVDAQATDVGKALQAHGGAKVVIAARSAERLGEAAAAIDPTGASVEAVVADILDPASMEALVERSKERFGRVDALE